MAKSKLSLNDKSDSELLTFSQQHIAAMAGNANFTTPMPDATAFQTLHDDYETALDDAALAQDAAKQKTAEKDVARAALVGGLNQRGGYVDSASGGDEAKILSSGFPVRTPPTPIGELPAPLDFLATMGDLEGEIDLVWSRVYGAASYVIQKSPYATPRVWTQAAVVSKSKATITNCPSGEVCVFRVAAVGAAGQGPWSDESVKMAP
jgi:hypothetical protein